MPVFPQLQMLGKVVLAGLLAGVVGLEREFAERPAGLRTHMLVGATSTLLVLLAMRAISVLSPISAIKADPIQIVQAIVIGVSFLGAGTIFRNSQRPDEPVQGLTTGASLLSVAAIGIAVGLDAYLVAFGVTVWNLAVTWGLGYLEDRVKARVKNK